MKGTYSLMARLLYGAGLRLTECTNLRVKDVDFSTNQILVRDGKGFKDRVTMLPESLREELLSWINRPKSFHQQQLERGTENATRPRLRLAPGLLISGQLLFFGRRRREARERG